MELKGRFWTWYWGGNAFLAVYNVSWDWVLSSKVCLASLLVLNLPQQVIWALAWMVLIIFARKYPLLGVPWRRSWLWGGYFLVTAGVTCVAIATNYVISLTLPPSSEYLNLTHLFNPIRFKMFFWKYFHTYWLVVWAVVGLVHVHLLMQRLRERELGAALMEGRIAQAQNLALRMQLQPHFLFNALNSVTALIYSDPEAADRMLSRLAELLRTSLDRSPEQELCLHEELDFMERYLSLERIRYGERLDVHVEVPPELQRARVPNLVLQPLVENAIKHGISSRAEGGRIWIRARKEEDRLVLEVQDDGEGFTERAEGIGLSSTRERLRLLYKDRFRFDLTSRAGRGTLAALRIPLVFPDDPKGT